jgi:hypothetical protein
MDQCGNLISCQRNCRGAQKASDGKHWHFISQGKKSVGFCSQAVAHILLEPSVILTRFLLGEIKQRFEQWLAECREVLVREGVPITCDSDAVFLKKEERGFQRQMRILRDPQDKLHIRAITNLQKLGI